MAKLNAKGRKRIKKSNFAIPERRAYPVHDRAHAKNALARVSQHGTAKERKRVRSKVARKYPSLTKNSKSQKRSSKKRSRKK